MQYSTVTFIRGFGDRVYKLTGIGRSLQVGGGGTREGSTSSINGFTKISVTVSFAR